MTLPKGKLIIIGGAVDKGSFSEKNFNAEVDKNLNFFETGILKRLITESAEKENSIIEIIPTASSIPIEVGEEYCKALKYLGAKNTRVMNITSRQEANETEILDRLMKAHVVFFTGGDQLRLSTIIGGTKFHDILLQKYKTENFIYAGTSAGAAAASNNMIYQGSSSEALLKGEVKMTNGLALIDHVVIDTHFVQRGRMGRLMQAVCQNPRMLGIGLGEDTGLFIYKGQMEAIGSGLVILVDGRHIEGTNITEVALGEPISIKNLIVHVMSMYDVYDISSHDLKIDEVMPAKNPKL
ncbi:MAG: cyanophycinase [Chitinophagales bacterium]|jgi:cyanophycinase|nr:cyanophycinase [Chitinophagales bacterium]